MKSAESGFWLLLAVSALSGDIVRGAVTKCAMTARTRWKGSLRRACFARGMELLRCDEMLSNSSSSYCPSVCVAHTAESRCVCEGRTDAGGPCVAVGLTPGWSGRRGEIRVDPCVPCDTLPLDLPCDGYEAPSWCGGRLASGPGVLCSTWEECAREEDFGVVVVDGFPCPDDRQGPFCLYAPPDRSLLRVSLLDRLTMREGGELEVPEGHEAVVSLLFAWDAWRHKEDLKTSEMRILASGSASTLNLSPCRVAASNGTHVTCSWNVTFERSGAQDLLFNLSYRYDHSYVTAADGRRRRVPEWGRVFSFPVEVTPDPGRCLPDALIRGVSPERVYRRHDRWRPLLAEGVLVPTPDCLLPAGGLRFCWSVLRSPYAPSLDPLFGYPQPEECAVVGRCSQPHEASRRLFLPAHFLDYGHYTVQLAVGLGRDLLSEPRRRKCATGYATVAPSPLEVAIEGGLFRTHFRALPLVLDALAVDPDVPGGGGAAPRHLEFSWSCETTDPDPGAVCRTPLDADGRVRTSLGGRRLVVAEGALSGGRSYVFSVGVRRLLPGREEAQSAQEVEAVSQPAPDLRIACDALRVHPEDRWVLRAECETCRFHPIPVYYEWRIVREGGPEGEFDWRNGTVAGVGSGTELTTVVVLPGSVVPGATYDVQVRGEFRPVTRRDFMHLGHLLQLLLEEE